MHLIKLVDDYGENQWNLVSSFMNNRSPKQCRERYHYFLAPNIQNPPWGYEDISKLISLVSIYGTKWKLIITYFPGRSETNLKKK
jgi:hypothetical protein